MYFLIQLQVHNAGHSRLLLGLLHPYSLSLASFIQPNNFQGILYYSDAVWIHVSLAYFSLVDIDNNYCLQFIRHRVLIREIRGSVIREFKEVIILSFRSFAIRGGISLIFIYLSTKRVINIFSEIWL